MWHPLSLSLSPSPPPLSPAYDLYLNATYFSMRDRVTKINIAKQEKMVEKEEEKKKKEEEET